MRIQRNVCARTPNSAVIPRKSQYGAILTPVTDVTGVRISRMKRKWNEGIRTGGNLPPVNDRFLESVPKNTQGAQLGAPRVSLSKKPRRVCRPQAANSARLF